MNDQVASAGSFEMEWDSECTPGGDISPPSPTVRYIPKHRISITPEAMQLFQELFERQAPVQELDKTPDGPRACSCPKENFRWGGLGCQCGGV